MTVNIHGDLDAGMPQLLRDVLHGCKEIPPTKPRYVHNSYVLTPTALNAERVVNFLQDSATILVKARPCSIGGEELSRNAGHRGVANGRCPDHSRPETAA